MRNLKQQTHTPDLNKEPWVPIENFLPCVWSYLLSRDDKKMPGIERAVERTMADLHVKCVNRKGSLHGGKNNRQIGINNNKKMCKKEM